MIELFKSDRPSDGVVHFRGQLPTRPAEYDFLRAQRIDIEPITSGDDSHWAMRLRHPTWGTAEVVCPREAAPELPHLDHVPGLDDEERAAIRASRSSVLVRVPAKQKTVLRDRKTLLRFMGALMGDDGVGAIDAQSMLVWTRRALDDELAHDADLDVQALYCVHAVKAADGPSERVAKGEDEGEDEPPCKWLHTHGLAELGAFDFDVLRPSPDVVEVGSDVLRAVAFAIVEKKIGPSESEFLIAHPDGVVRLVPAAEFMRTAPRELVELRAMDDDSHDRNRSVLCEPAARGLRSLFAKKSVMPSRFLSREIPEQFAAMFTEAATELMAQRAQKTMGVFEKVAAELAEYKLPALAKIGYPTDGGAQGEVGGHEHLWFEVHGFRPGAIDGTLMNQPFNIAAMNEGDRGWHDVENLSDWSIMSPMGAISPRNMYPLHMVRKNPELAKTMSVMMGMGLC